jgi:hypothetical protein
MKKSNRLNFGLQRSASTNCATACPNGGGKLVLMQAIIEVFKSQSTHKL